MRKSSRSFGNCRRGSLAVAYFLRCAINLL
nr:MAG TPA: hypothetical protein [Caudoviricetes sp.]DAS92336.1 MAG TPA: hypothetical protein [Bacteriophage sp.]DAF18911.1 MAG TPA: hypothetical protein [Caudoviricetes sp.]DAJ28351.1 MAG TPA: hypothetical protein [Caudoviricetes sp.]DAJ56387.1 MAG TPA: hypothetical protein [Caudoviricetes sp.]